MRRILIAMIVLGLAACDDAPKPKPAPPQPIAKPEPPKPPVAEVKPEPKPEPVKPDPNKELAAKVKRALESEAKIQAAGIDVTASDGKVTLWGTAASNGERNRAGNAAKKVEGVTAVDNQLKVVKGS